MQPEIEIDTASYPDFEHLVAELSIGPELSMVISKEPGEADFFVTICGSGVARAPSMLRPEERNGLTVADLLAAIDRACKSLA